MDQALIALIRGVDVATKDQFAAFVREDTIDIEKLMQLFVADTFEDFDFMSPDFTDAIEVLVAIYNGVKQFGEFDYGGLPHYLVDDFTRYGFTLEDRVVDLEDHVRVVQTQNVTLIIERFNEDENGIESTESVEEEDEDEV
jgi:hypothetical protein